MSEVLLVKRNFLILLTSLLLVALMFSMVSADETVNLALGAPVRSSTSVDDFGWFAENATNGMRDFDEEKVIRGWSSTILYFQPEIASYNTTQWIKIDLKDIYKISQVDLYPRSDGSNAGEYFPIDFVIQVSTEDSAWKQNDEGDTDWITVVTQTGVDKPAGGAVQSYTFEPIEARYVRIKATNLQRGSDGYVFQLAEIEVYE